MCMERTNQPILQSLKGQARTLTGKTHHVITITQPRKDQAQPDGLRGWDRVLHKAPVPLEHHQDQEGINTAFFPATKSGKPGQPGDPIFPRMVGETGSVLVHLALSHFLRRILCWHGIPQSPAFKGSVWTELLPSAELPREVDSRKKHIGKRSKRVRIGSLLF
jgi:hypothetical protein